MFEIELCNPKDVYYSLENSNLFFTENLNLIFQQIRIRTATFSDVQTCHNNLDFFNSFPDLQAMESETKMTMAIIMQFSFGNKKVEFYSC